MIDAPATSVTGRWARIHSPRAILALLLLINLVNYLDRQIIFTLNPVLKREFALSDTQVGLLGSVFAIVLAVFSVPLGVLADRWRRKWVIALGVGLWSVATALSAFAGSFGALLFYRSLVGIGEATYAPAASALITERFPHERRARAIGVFNLGMIVGGGAGMALGGLLGETLGWRAPFLIVGLPGLALAIAAAAIDEGPRRKHGEWVISVEMPDAALLRRPVLAAIYAGGTLVSFFVWGFLYWMPHFMEREHGFRASAAALFMALAGAAAGAGVWFGSWLADRVGRTRPDAKLLVGALGMLAALPFVVACLLVSSSAWMLAGLVMVAFFATWFTAPLLAALCELVTDQRRATATGFYFMIVQLLGTGLSTTAVGALSQRWSLRGALLATVGVALAGALALLAGARAQRHEERDRVRARAQAR
ncbi:MAG: MFS transporter [Myxococcota bacterium]